jgi:8-oxo-dGTP pyrophosphatase MutT (NUDIX family)
MAPKTPPGALLSFIASPTLVPFNVQVKDYLSSHPSKHRIVAAALVFSPSNPSHVLIVQRSATDYVPNLWEIPGGSCDHDESILAGAVRELWEESGLVATKVLRQVGESYEWLEEGTVWCKFSFEVEVEGMEVILDEEEHQAFFWVTEDECRKGEVMRDEKRTEIKWTNESQVAVILEGFRLRAAAQLTSQACPSCAVQHASSY